MLSNCATKRRAGAKCGWSMKQTSRPLAGLSAEKKSVATLHSRLEFGPNDMQTMIDLRRIVRAKLVPELQADSSPHPCDGMARALDDLSIPLAYNDKFREHSIPIQDGGSSVAIIQFCPFCGAKLPDSLRDEWFERLDQLGLEPDSPELPLDLRSGAWWRRTRPSPEKVSKSCCHVGIPSGQPD